MKEQELASTCHFVRYLILLFQLSCFRVSSSLMESESETGTYTQTDEKFTCEYTNCTAMHEKSACFT